MKNKITLTKNGIKEIKRIIRELKNGEKISCIEWENYTINGTVREGFDCDICHKVFPLIGRPDCPQTVYSDEDIIKILSTLLENQ